MEKKVFFIFHFLVFEFLFSFFKLHIEIGRICILDPECSIRVKQLFIDMNMLELYREFAYGKYDSIRALIAAADCEDPIKNVLFKTVDLVFHRSMLKSNETFEIPKN